MVYPRYSALFPEVKSTRDRLEKDYTSLQAETEEKAKSMTHDEAVKFLSEYGNRTAQSMLYEWNQLAQTLIVKYNDMSVKRTNEQGQYEKTPGGNQRPVLRPGYPDAYRHQIIKQTGDRFLNK